MGAFGLVGITGHRAKAGGGYISLPKHSPTFPSASIFHPWSLSPGHRPRDTTRQHDQSSFVAAHDPAGDMYGHNILAWRVSLWVRHGFVRPSPGPPYLDLTHVVGQISGFLEMVPFQQAFGTWDVETGKHLFPPTRSGLIVGLVSTTASVTDIVIYELTSRPAEYRKPPRGPAGRPVG